MSEEERKMQRIEDIKELLSWYHQLVLNLVKLLERYFWPCIASQMLGCILYTDGRIESYQLSLYIFTSPKIQNCSIWKWTPRDQLCTPNPNSHMYVHPRRSSHISQRRTPNSSNLCQCRQVGKLTLAIQILRRQEGWQSSRRSLYIVRLSTTAIEKAWRHDILTHRCWWQLVCTPVKRTKFMSK